MPYRLMDDSGYHAMVRESVPWSLANGVLADCSNIIFDNPGVGRLRMGSTALVSGAQTAFCQSIGFCYSQDGTIIEELYGFDGKAGVFYSINKANGAATSLGSLGTTGMVAGRPIRHFGFLYIPYLISATGLRKFATVAGQTTVSTFISTATSSVTANNQQITLSGADVTTNIKVGALVNIPNALLGTRGHTGRVVSIDTTKLFTIWPAPTFTDAGIGAGGLLAGALSVGPGGTCGCSFQNRLLYGNTNDLASVGTSLVSDRRVYYSPLPTESITTPGGVTTSGSNWGAPGNWPANNYFDVPGADPIVAMEPVNDGELVILTNSSVIIFRGTLATQTTTQATGVTWDLSPLPVIAGCLSDLSVQRTPQGLMWAGADGIYAYWPPLRRSPGHTGLRDVTQGKIHTFWRDVTRGSNFLVHGAAYVRNHYLLAVSSGGTTYCFCYNLTNESWSLLTGVGTDMFIGLLRPTDPSQVFASRWWDVTGAAPSMTNGQVIRLDSMFAKYVAGATTLDADANSISFSLTTRSLTDDAMTPRIARRVGIRYQAAMTAPNIQVQASSRYDSADISGGAGLTTLGNLSNTSVFGISGQSNATPIVITTTSNHGLQTGDFVQIHNVSTNTNANGHFQITVLSNTTFSLNQSSGNGATTGSGTGKKLTEQEFECSGMDIGPSTYVKITNTGTVNNFELHGVRVGALEIPHGLGH